MGASGAQTGVGDMRDLKWDELVPVPSVEHAQRRAWRSRAGPDRASASPRGRNDEEQLRVYPGRQRVVRATHHETRRCFHGEGVACQALDQSVGERARGESVLRSPRAIVNSPSTLELGGGASTSRWWGCARRSGALPSMMNSMARTGSSRQQVFEEWVEHPPGGVSRSDPIASFFHRSPYAATTCSLSTNGLWFNKGMPPLE
jgi:hypothetical protein